VDYLSYIQEVKKQKQKKATGFTPPRHAKHDMDVQYKYST